MKKSICIVLVMLFSSLLTPMQILNVMRPSKSAQTVMAASASIYLNAETVEQKAAAILNQSGIQGGFIIHLNCNDGELTAALGASEQFVVQGLASDVRQLTAARERIVESGLYGRVSVAPWDEERLPYAENLANLIIAGEGVSIPEEELMRVLAPGGAALLKSEEGWTPLRKPWPDDIDDWSHYLHGPDNNAVSQDLVVGPPQQMQWVCGPKYARSHEINSSMAGMVTAGGRLFYIWDDGPTGLTDPRFPPKWSLIARDGFNGTLLWKQPMPNWGWRQWHDPSRWDDQRERAKMLRHLPATTTRRLVASEDRLYVTLGFEAPVSIIDAATGEIIQEIEHTELTDEILLDEDALILRLRLADQRPDRDMWDALPIRQSGFIMAVDVNDGSVLWRSEPDDTAPLTLAASGGRVFYSNYDQVVCLDQTTGDELWRGNELTAKSGHRGTAGTLVATEEVVLYAFVPSMGGSNSGGLQVYDAASGEPLWEGPKYTGPGVTNPPDLFVADGLVWLGETRLPVDIWETEMFRQGYDPVTGEVLREISVPFLTSPGHHYRCYRSKATERFLLLPKRGVEFLDLTGDDHMRHDWLRAPCIYGFLPANGILYTAPHQCVCYQGVLMSNFNALTAIPSDAVNPPAPEQRLLRGPAWGTAAEFDSASDEDWPMYRCNPERSGSVATNVPNALTRQWEISLNGEITPPVSAEGRVFVAEKNAHVIHAFRSESGSSLWSFTAGGRIDSPPTIYGSLVLFGAADGWVYCLKASDGEEVWRFMAAPYDRRITAFGQVESAWPVHGTVLVQKDATSEQPRDLAYFTAGRSTYLDGGIYAYALDPESGRLIHQNQLDGPRPDPYEDRGGAGYMDGAKSDILVSDGADLFLHQERFRSDLTRCPAPMENMQKERGGFRIYPEHPERGSTGVHLLSTRGFLDDTYNEGTYWTYGARWPGWDRHMNGVPAYGQILSFDENALYGVHVFTDSVRVRRGFFPGTKGYRLYSRAHGAAQDAWSQFIPMRVRAMTADEDQLFVAGPPDVVPEDDPLGAFEGRLGFQLWAFSKQTGEKLFDADATTMNGGVGVKMTEVDQIDGLPVYDGLIAANKRLYLSTSEGRLICYGE